MVIGNENKKKLFHQNYYDFVEKKRCFDYTPFAVRGCIETETESEWQRHACHDHNNHNIECYAVHICILLRYLK